MEQSWLDLMTSQGSGKDLKKVLAPFMTRSQPKPEGQATGLASLIKQRGVKAPRRKK